MIQISGTTTTFGCPPGSHLLTRTTSEEYCSRCGLVNGTILVSVRPTEYLDELGPRTEYFGRTGSPLIPDLISKFDGKGNRVKSRNDFLRLQRRTVYYQRQGVRECRADVVTTRRIIGTAISLMEMPNEAAVDAHRVLCSVPSSTFRGSSFEDRCAGAIYVTLRSKKWRVAVPMKDIVAAVSGSRPGPAFKASTKIRLTLHIPDSARSILDHLRYYAHRIGLNRYEKAVAEEILKDPELTNGNAANPVSYVASVTYLIGTRWGLPDGTGPFQRRSQETVAKATGVTAVTIRTVTSQLLDRRSDEIGEIVRRMTRTSRMETNPGAGKGPLHIEEPGKGESSG